FTTAPTIRGNMCRCSCTTRAWPADRSAPVRRSRIWPRRSPNCSACSARRTAPAFLTISASPETRRGNLSQEDDPMTLTAVHIREAAESIRGKTALVPEIGLILGSGLGLLADHVEDAAVIRYEDIPHFP